MMACSRGQWKQGKVQKVWKGFFNLSFIFRQRKFDPNLTQRRKTCSKYV